MKKAVAQTVIYQITLWLADIGNGAHAHGVKYGCVYASLHVCVHVLKCCWYDTFITGDIHELNSCSGRAEGVEDRC